MVLPDDIADSPKRWPIGLRELFLVALERFTHLISLPFAKAQSLEEYASVGYGFFGVLLGFGIAVLLRIGLGSVPISQAPIPLQVIYKWLLKRSQIEIPEDTNAPVWVVPLLIYGALYFWKTARFWFGEIFANGFVWLVDQSLEAGEWCLERRWTSLFLVIALAAGIAFGLNHELEASRRRQILDRDYEHWLAETEDLVEHSSVSHSEFDRYRNIRSDWPKGLAAMNPHADIESTGFCLSRMLDELYSGEDQRLWSDTLALKRESLESILNSCPPLNAGQSALARRALALMNILMGRIYVRLFETLQEPSLLVGAFERFKAAEAIDLAKSTDTSSEYHSAAINGRGTVFVEVLDAQLSPSWAGNQAMDSLRALCHDRHECAIKAYNDYEKAAESYGRCSFEDKRRVNNEVDLLVRIGSRYDEFVRNSPDTFDPWIESPEELAAVLEERVRTLMQCNSAPPLISATFVTAAQALAIAAQLRHKMGQVPVADLRAAGFYLVLATSFEPQNAADWQLSYFCFAISNQAMEQEFRAGLDAPPEALRPTVRLLRMIRKQCP